MELDTNNPYINVTDRLTRNQYVGIQRINV